ncbi:inhibitor of Bruton tyrosine kinase [Anopheles maculipalpis]|uniref:inhibitor of Bruton tyrosine kinase n=1 Tax=Anopheles maculipalpis TaxID=1496333 RepID=UPI0021599890|nr:inhibitor of Bruton tyrosine kinase [Anopheles maculipalpis]
MFTISDYDYECTKKCRLVSHGNAITAALTKRAVSDELLAAYIAKTCRNFAHVLDDHGRTALHMAASVGRSAIVEWLINQGASLTQKDLESGHTALHRAMYYGNVGAAVLLVKHGAALDAPDEDFVNPIQLCSNVSEQRTGTTDGRIALGPELMIWGQNKNYNLGIGNAQDKGNPESMEYFRKTRTTIRKLEISSYHSVFLTHRMGELYVAGHGVGGRLGLGMEDTIAYPMKVPLALKDDERITDVAAAKYHTLVLTDSNHIYSCGENKHCQLGLKPPPPNLLAFKEITGQCHLSGKAVKRVIAKDYHSIAVLETEFYVWGLNGGQFGLKRDSRNELIVLPKAIPLIPDGTTPKDDGVAVKRDTTIKLIESSNAAIVVYTMQNFLHIFSGFKVKTYKKPLMEKLECLSVAGGELQTEQDDVVKRSGDLRVIVFTTSRNIYIWYEDCQQFVRCVFAQSRNLEVEKIRWCSQNTLVLLLGNLYQGIITNKLPRSAKQQFSEFKETYIRKELCDTLQSRIELRRIRNLSNVVDFTCDADGENYAALVENTRRCFCVPELVESNYDYGTLLADANEMDGVHDVVLYVEDEPIASHRFILYHRSEALRKLLQQFPGQKEFVLKEHGLGGITLQAFRLIMRYLYTNQLIARADVERLLRKLGSGEIGSNADDAELNAMCQKLKQQFDKLRLPVLSQSVKKLQNEPPIEPFPMLRHDSYPELYDITLELQDDKKMRAHKCVLVARLDYFNMMFAHCWTEKRTVADLKTVPREYMDVIIPFLYDNDYGRVRRQRYSENFILSMIIICDQFLIEELKSIFETILSQRVHLRNVGELLEFSYQYNCELLKSVCMQFVSVNFARLLEWHLLDGLEPTILEQIDHFYKEFFRLGDYRMITPFADAIGDEELEQFVSDFRIDLDQKASADQPIVSSDRSTKLTPKGKQTNMTALSKLQREKRNYEKEAMVYLERLVLEEAAAVKERKISASKSANAPSTSYTTAPKSKPDTTLERSVPDENVTNKVWQTVSADSKRKAALSAALRANELMKEEAQQPSSESFSNLRTVLERSPTAPQLVPLRSPDEGYESASNVPPRAATLNLSDFTIHNARLSQKERKRLNSEKSKVAKTSSVEIPAESVPIVPVNPWKNVANVPVADLFKPSDPILGSDVPLSGRKQRNNSINESSKPVKAEPGIISSTSSGNAADQSSTIFPKKPHRQRHSSTRYSGGDKDFNEILEEERLQKRYFEKIKSKSLVQTQIEEQAIEELRAFYNVEHVFDENITIERYRPPLLENGPNFAVWQYQ